MNNKGENVNSAPMKGETTVILIIAWLIIGLLAYFFMYTFIKLLNSQTDNFNTAGCSLLFAALVVAILILNSMS